MGGSSGVLLAIFFAAAGDAASNGLSMIESLHAGLSRMQEIGGAKRGRHSGAWETFWSIRARRPQSWPAGWGPDQMNLVGVVSRGARSDTSPNGRWFEPLPPLGMEPRNLHEAQLERRMAGRR